MNSSPLAQVLTWAAKENENGGNVTVTLSYVQVYMEQVPSRAPTRALPPDAALNSLRPPPPPPGPSAGTPDRLSAQVLDLLSPTSAKIEIGEDFSTGEVGQAAAAHPTRRQQRWAAPGGPPRGSTQPCCRSVCPQVVLPGVVLRACTTEAEARGFLRLGEERRITCNQRMNAQSSRSHALLFVAVERRTAAGGGGGGPPVVRRSKLLLVDLAGSERVARSGVEGTQFEEAKSVNLSLTALGKCIQLLTDPNPGHIPYRDAKLTRLLKDSLGGSARTSLIVCVSPTRESANESMSRRAAPRPVEPGSGSSILNLPAPRPRAVRSLVFGTRALGVKNVLKAREEVDFQMMCRRLQAQCDLLHVQARGAETPALDLKRFRTWA